MNRHGYGNANGHAGSNGAYPLSPTFVESRGRTFSIRPDKYEKYSPRSTRNTLQRRKGILMRLAAALTAILLLLIIIFPSIRPTAVFPALSLGLFSAVDQAFQIETVRYYDLQNVVGTSRGWERNERILLCAPLRDAAPHLPMFFSHLKNLTYPHNLIDLAFLVGDSKDNTISLLSDLLADLQAQHTEDPKKAFGEISVIEKDFGQTVNQDVESRHGFAAQASRRKSMAQARNWLLSAALRPTHSWVYWRDVDVETAPFTILEDLMRHNKDIIVPNVWRPLPDWLGGEQPYDLNSWQESETALALADTLDEDAVIVEGYAEYATWRPHLAYLRDPYGDPDMEMDIDGVGGVSILAKARVFRSGVHFPAFSFEKHAETEGFGKMAKRMQFSVVGLPHYTIWHLYEPSVDDIRHMEEMEQERKQREEEERQRVEREQKIASQFDVEGRNQWEKDREAVEVAQREVEREARAKEEAKRAKEDEVRRAKQKVASEVAAAEKAEKAAEKGKIVGAAGGAEAGEAAVRDSVSGQTKKAGGAAQGAQAQAQARARGGPDDDDGASEVGVDVPLDQHTDSLGNDLEHLGNAAETQDLRRASSLDTDDIATSPPPNDEDLQQPDHNPSPNPNTEGDGSARVVVPFKDGRDRTLDLTGDAHIGPNARKALLAAQQKERLAEKEKARLAMEERGRRFKEAGARRERDKGRIEGLERVVVGGVGRGVVDFDGRGVGGSGGEEGADGMGEEEKGGEGREKVGLTAAQEARVRRGEAARRDQRRKTREAANL